MLRQLFSKYSELDRRVVKVAPVALKRAREYIHAYSNASIHLSDLAAVADLSKGSLIESFKTYFGVTPQHYLIQVRLDKARHLLRNGAAIADAAYAVGFAD